MAIEFRCNGCSKMLRVSDENAGKKAKCPQCGTIADVPLASEPPPAPGEFVPAPMASPPTARGGYADDVPGGFRTSNMDPLNPYASSSAVSSFAEAKPASGPLQHRRVSIDEVLNRAWAIFQSQLGPCALFGLVFVAITFGVSMATGSFRVVAQMVNDPVVMAVAVVGQQLVGFFVNTFFQLGLTVFALRLARTGEARLNDLFGGGPYYLRGLLGTFLFQLMMAGVVLVCLGPGLLTILTQEEVIFIPALIVGGVIAVIFVILLALRFYLMIVFIVDQNMRVGEAFRASAMYMAGNKLAAFLGGLILSVLGGVVVICTCFIGTVLVAPFAGLFLATLYLLVTGQPVHVPLTNKPISPVYPANP
jgi:phage FluMu protein Com